MSCCPPSRCGLAPPSDYKAQGKEMKLGDLSCYEIGEAKKGAVIVIADIFGYVGRLLVLSRPLNLRVLFLPRLPQ